MLLFAFKKSSRPPSPAGGGCVLRMGEQGGAYGMMICFSKALYALSRI